MIGTAPLLDAVSTIDNGPHGGNLDVPEFGPGATVILPVAVDDALFFLGDCHAVQGDGELCGVGAIEIRTRTTVVLDLAPRPPVVLTPFRQLGASAGQVVAAAIREGCHAPRLLPSRVNEVTQAV